MLFNPSALQASSQDCAREEMVKIDEMCRACLKIGSFVTVGVAFDPEAYRIKNGAVTAGFGCARPGRENIKMQKTIKHPGITYRVAAVDEDLCTVLMRPDFGETSLYESGSKLVTWEEFKVYGGAIQAVEAFIRYMPSCEGSGWK